MPLVQNKFVSLHSGVISIVLHFEIIKTRFFRIKPKVGHTKVHNRHSSYDGNDGPMQVKRKTLTAITDRAANRKLKVS